MHAQGIVVKYGRLATIALRAIGAIILLTPAAQAQDGQPRGVLEEVIVTAEKRSANLQDVPLAVSAFDQQALDEWGVTDIASVQNWVPNMQFTTIGNFTSSVVVTLRGIGTDVTTSGADQGVALHMDGVYLGKSSAALLSFFDLERLEVLRGPQGTLYGRNATGGSVNVISAAPSEEFEAFGDILAGNYNRYRVRGVVNGQLADGIAGRLTATWEERDGYLENLVPGGTDGHDKDEWGIRGQLRFDVGDRTEILARVFASESGGVGATMTGTEHPPALMVGINQPPPFQGTPIGVPTFRPGFANALPIPDELHHVLADAHESFNQKARGANVTVTWDHDAFSLKSITGWFSNETDIFRDGDRSELPLYTKRRVEEARQFSQEFNLTSNSAGAWEWIVGAFFYREEVDDRNTTVDFPPEASIPGATGYVFSFDSTVEATSWALFGQASYSFSEQLRATLGLRYSVDKKDGLTRSRDVVDPNTGIHLIGFPQSGAYSDSWNRPTGKIGLDYFVNDDSMLYFSFSTGYKSGGLNINAPDQAIFEPELIDAWEVGSKNRLLGNRLELNASAFYYDYEDLQLFSVTESAPFIQNAGKSTITGLEIESKFLPTDNITLDLSVAYLDAEIKDFVTKDPADPPPLQQFEDLSGNRLPRAPEWELSVNASYDWYFDHGQLRLSGHYHWQDDMYFRPQNDLDKRQDAYDTVGARLTYFAGDGRWRISAFGENLGDTDAISNLIVEAGLFGSPVLVTPIPPRTYGVEFGFQFN